MGSPGQGHRSVVAGVVGGDLWANPVRILGLLSPRPPWTMSLNAYNIPKTRWAQVISELQEMKQLQREHNVQMEKFGVELNHQMGKLNSNVGSLTGVLQDILTHLVRANPPTTNPLCGATTSVATTSVTPTEREALPGRPSPPHTLVPAAVDPNVFFRRGHSSGPAVDDAQTRSTTTKRHKP